MSNEALRIIFRKIRQIIYRWCDLFSPYVTSRNYLGYKLFYIKGPRIIDRLRFLAPTPIYEKEVCEYLVNNLKKN